MLKFLSYCKTKVIKQKFPLAACCLLDKAKLNERHRVLKSEWDWSHSLTYVPLVQWFTDFPWSLKTPSHHPRSWLSLQIALDYDCTAIPSSPNLTFLSLAFQQTISTYLSKTRPDMSSSVKPSLTSPGRLTGSSNAPQHFVHSYWAREAPLPMALCSFLTEAH